jgi:hypothetical protein
MALDGPGFARLAERVRAYLAGRSPAVLVPVGGGDPVPFVADGQPDSVEWSEGQVLLNSSRLIAWTAVRLPLGSRWLYRGVTWQVASIDHAAAAGADWPHRVELVGQARGAREGGGD